MDQTPVAAGRVNQAVPLLDVADMAASTAFYVDGLGCRIDQRWEVDGRLRWCLLEVGGARLMIQGPRRASDARPGAGWVLCLMCDDALAVWRLARARGLSPQKPYVGNGLWVTSLTDPDGYRLDFESPTDAPEETEHHGD